MLKILQILSATSFESTICFFAGLSNASLSYRCVVLNIHDMVKPCFFSSAPSYIAESKSGGRLSLLSETIT